MTSHPDRTEQYQHYRSVIADAPLPLALIDLDAVDANIDALIAPLRNAGKGLRIATKSLRCPALVRYIMARAGGISRGVMTYTAEETRYLSQQGIKDLVLAYPTVHPADIEALIDANRSGATAAVVVDSREHIEHLEAAASAAGVKIPVVIEVDVSYHPFGDAVHVGVWRSPIRTVEQVLALVDQIQRLKHLTFHGLMGYEAHIAGLPDRNPFAPALNPAKRFLKERARVQVEKTRRNVISALTARDQLPRIFNGGGTGSIHWCAQDQALTEVTVGSGFVDSLLFDYYRDLSLVPAAFFAIQVVRRPAPNIVTCHGGGFIASGEAGPDRLPRPWLPAGLSLIELEGAGEVQTPLKHDPNVSLRIGDPVFFRHAKAGELSEHVSEYWFVRGDRVISREPTYRGLGKTFLG